MSCVTTVTFSVLINDHLYGIITPSRGIRQGDPLSPFLFVLCTEGLSNLINQAELNGAITGLQFSSQGPAIHHLFFADDSLFVCKAELEEIKTLFGILWTYGEATGQIVNISKSSLTFGTHVDDIMKESIKAITGIENEGVLDLT